MRVAIYERVRCAALTRAFSSRSADLFLPETVRPIWSARTCPRFQKRRHVAALQKALQKARRRAARCCQLSDGYPREDARCRARYHFQRRAAVAGATRFSPVAGPARTNGGGRSKDRLFSLRPRSERAWKRRLPRRFA